MFPHAFNPIQPISYQGAEPPFKKSAIATAEEEAGLRNDEESAAKKQKSETKVEGEVEPLAVAMTQEEIQPLSVVVLKEKKECSLLDLPEDTLTLIIRRLTFKSFLAFEQVSLACKRLCGSRWKILLVNHGLDFEWQECVRSSYPERTQFVLGKLVHAYADKRLSNQHSAQELLDLFKGMMKIYPRFAAFVYRDLKDKVGFETYDKTFYEDVLKTSLQQPAKAGGLLLEALLDCFKLNEHEKEGADVEEEPSDEWIEEKQKKSKILRGQVFQSVSRAVLANATCASEFVSQIYDGTNEDEDQLIYTLAILSFGKNSNYRPLEKCLNKCDVRSDSGVILPPVLVDQAQALLRENELSLEKIAKAEDLLKRAIEGYGPHVPPHVLFIFAEAKAKTDKWIEVDELYTRGIAYSEENGYPIGFREVCYASFVKDKLGKGSEAAQVLFYFASLKCKSEQWEADDLCNRAITYSINKGISISVHDLLTAAFVKYKLGNRQEAHNLYSTAFAFVYTNGIDVLVPEFLDAIFVMSNDLGGFTQALSTLLKAALTKFNLKKWDEADQLYTQTFNLIKSPKILGGTLLAMHIYFEAARVKSILKKWAEADEIYSQAFAQKSYVIPFSMQELYDAAFVKSQLKEWSEVDRLLTLARINSEKNKEEISTECLVLAGVAKSKLKQLNDAKRLIDQGISKYQADQAAGNEVTDSTKMLIAEAYKELEPINNNFVPSS